MRTYNFVIKGEAPWGTSTTPAQKKLEQGKNCLLALKLTEAHRCFSSIAHGEGHAPNDRLWGYLLCAYNKYISTYYGVELILYPTTTVVSPDRASKPLQELDYEDACLINENLAKEEYNQYDPVAVLLKQMILLGSTQGHGFDFQTLHEQAWCIYRVERFTLSSDWDNAQREIDKGLARVPDNHYLLSYKSKLIISKSETLATIVEAEKTINQAIDLCPKVVQASADLACYYFMRARYRKKKHGFVNASERMRIRSEIISDYQNTFKSEFTHCTLVDKESYLRLLDIIKNSSFLDPQTLAKSHNEKLIHLCEEICKDKTKVELYLERGALYERVGEKDLAELDYIIALGLIRMGIVSVTDAYRKKVENILTDFTKTKDVAAVQDKLSDVKLEKEIKETMTQLNKTAQNLEVLATKISHSKELGKFLEIDLIVRKESKDLSYLFIMKNKAPWDVVTTPMQKKLQEGRDYLVSGKFDQAIVCFNDVAKQPQSIPTLRVWPFLLRGYINLMLSQMTDDVSQSARLVIAASSDFKTAREIDDLADQEFPVYETVKTHFKQVLLIQNEQKEEHDFQKIQEQAWCIQRAIHFIASKKPNEALQLALEGLVKMPTNHILYFVKYAFYATNLNDDHTATKSVSKAEEAINEAIKFCPPDSFHLYRHYYHRGKLIAHKITHLKQSEAKSRLRLVRNVISDYQFFLQGDREEHGDLNEYSRLELLADIQKIHASLDVFQIDKKEKTKILVLYAKIKGQPKDVDSYVARSAHYQTAGENDLACLDLNTAIWLLRLKMGTSLKYNQAYLEARFKKLSTPQDLKNNEALLLSQAKSAKEAPEEEEGPLKKPNKPVETPEARAARKDKQIKKEVASVLLDMVIQVKRRFRQEEEEKKKEEKAAKEKEKKQQKKILSTHRHIANVIQQKKEEEKKAEDKLQQVENDRKKKAEAKYRYFENFIKHTILNLVYEHSEVKERVEAEEKRQTHEFITHFIQKIVIDPAYAHIAENERIQEEKEQQRLESIYQQQEIIPFKALSQVWLPREVLRVGKGIKDLRGRIAKRAHVYGGTASKAGLPDNENKKNNHNKKRDYDLRIGLPLALAAPVVKRVFNLQNEPEELHGIITTEFTIGEEKQKAQLTISHSEDLANEELSYCEALRLDNLRLDFAQKTFMASFPHGSVHNPLHWWEIYFAQSLERALDQINQSRTAANWSTTLKTLSCPVLIFIGTEKNFQVYFYVSGRLETVIKTNRQEKLVLNIQLQESDFLLFNRDPYGRLIMTCQNQDRILELLSEVDKLCIKHFQKTLQKLNHDIAKQIADLKSIECILDPNYSFSIDPTRMLRLVYFTPALNYLGFSEEIYAAVHSQAKAYHDFINQQPGKVNSWLNKIFCREGKCFFTENLNNFIFLGLFERSFPGLMSLNANGMIRKWLNKTFDYISHNEHPSLNFLYAVYIKCLSLTTEDSTDHIIKSNSLFRENFKEVKPDPFLKQASESWNSFLKIQRLAQRKQSCMQQQPFIPLVYSNPQVGHPGFFATQAPVQPPINAITQPMPAPHDTVSHIRQAPDYRYG